MQQNKTNKVSCLRRLTFGGARHLWTFGLMLCLLFAGNLKVAAFSHEPFLIPYAHDDSSITPTLSQNVIHLRWCYFNSNGTKDNGYEGDVWLTIDGEEVLKLNEIYPTSSTEKKGITDVRGHESWNNTNGKQTKYAEGTFKWGDNKSNDGWIMMGERVYWSDHKDYLVATYTHMTWMRLTIMLGSRFDGKSHKIGIKGRWVDSNDTSGNTHLTVTTKAPNSITFPSSVKVARIGNKTAQVGGTDANTAISLTNESVTDGSNKTVSYKYAFDFYRSDQKGTNGTNRAGWNKDISYEQYRSGAASPMGSAYVSSTDASQYHSDGSVGATSATIYLNVDNYMPQTIYPRIMRYTPSSGYTFKDVANTALDGDYLGTSTTHAMKVENMKYYEPIVLKGYPRPNNNGNYDNASTADSAMHVTFDPWSKNATLRWEPQIYDKNKVDTRGKWVIFRKVTGTNDDTTVKLGSVDYGTKTFVDNTTDKTYGTKYTYTVTFSPTEWGNEITKFNEATGLNTSVRETLSRLDKVITSATASKDQNNKIKVSWKHVAMKDASTSNPYVIKIYRGKVTTQNGESTTEWEAEPCKEVSVTNSSTTSGSWEDTPTDTRLKSFRENYEYKLVVAAQEYSYEVTTNVGHIAGDAASISKVTTSRGNYANSVLLTWEVKRSGTADMLYYVKRRPLGSQKESDYQVIYSVSSSATSFSYEDKNAKPGCYYEYKIDAVERDTEGNEYSTSEQTDGFSLATGIVNGRVYYDTGTAVEGVKVQLLRNSENNTASAFRSLRFDGDEGMVIQPGGLNSLMLNDFSVQMWVKPSESTTSSANKLFFTNAFLAQLVYNATNKNYDVQIIKNSVSSDEEVKQTFTIAAIPAGEWTHLTFAYSATTGKVKLFAGKATSDLQEYTSDNTVKLSEQGATMRIAQSYVGNMDEVRIFSKELTKSEVLKNMDHRLSGSEEDLYAYYPMDEGINGINVVYDYSKKDGLNNNRHIDITTMTSDTDVPSISQFSLCAYTDVNGNYSITGIPFSGDGTSYSVAPVYGEHNFTPNKVNRYISTSSLVADAVDFQDISSFTVKGTVYFENTTYPVDSVRFAVDGVTCTKDNEVVLSDVNGEFEISVPIGYHYITVSKNGHTFVNEGRYPANPDANSNTTKEFTKNLTGVKFYDNTLVPVVGRVTGGPTEYTYPLGFGESSNNIGQVELKLQASDTYRLNVVKVDDEASSTFETATTDRTFDAPLDYKDNYANNPVAKTVQSKAWVGSGSDDNARVITIQTDPVTGEFAAMLPPLCYTVNSMNIINAPQQTSVLPGGNSKPVIDATKVLQVTTDSINYEAANGNKVKRTFNYVASLNQAYRTTPKLEVTQDGAKGKGALGEYSTTLKKSDGTKVTVNFYDKDAANLGFLPKNATEAANSAYTYKYPIFYKGAVYEFDLNLYETYTNYDGEESKTVNVPLPDVTITIGNEMGTGNTVALEVSQSETATDYQGNTMKDGSIVELKENEVQTDAQGHATYKWTCGWPNIQDDFTRTLTMTYKSNGTQSWQYNGMKGIILGGLQSGNNFVTTAPDEVSMILRDPSGSNSYSYVEEGYSTSHTEVSTFNFSRENVNTTESHFGVDLQKIVGLITPAGTLTAVSEEASTSSTLTVGLDITTTVDTNDATTKTVTTTKRIQTSDDPQFVGAMGDLFIGNAMNYIFGNVREVGLHFNDAETDFTLDMQTKLTMSKAFSTEFNYTQYHIENRLIPEFISQRNNFLIHVDSYNDIPANNTDMPKYYTTLDTKDYRFGTDNCDKKIWGDKAAKSGATEGPSYKMVMPADFKAENDKYKLKAYNDTISFYNAQISGWEETLERNERSKVTALENRKDYLQTNISFDGGAAIESSVTNTKSHEYEVTTHGGVRVVMGFATNFEIAGTGVDVSSTTTTEFAGGDTWTDGTEETKTVGYVIADNSDDDVLSISVFDDPEGYGPIFYTEAGQTSCPYEDVVETKYYQPGYVISQKTMQVEQPHISAEVVDVTGVPVGKPASFTVMLQNTSETDEDCYFNLNVMDGTNPNGAGVYMDDVSLNYGRTILVPAGKTLYKTVQIKPTKDEVVDYNNLGIRISSVCQPDNTGTFPEIADTLFLSAHFQQTSSAIDLATSESALNISTGPVLHTTISGYDFNSSILKGVRLQAQLAGSPDWILVKEWLKDATEAQQLGKDVLTENGTFQYSLDMSNAQAYPDGTWNIRVITVSNYGNTELTTPSQLITLSKDMARPQLITAATPTNGILTADSEISLTFNEDIRSGALAKADNFIINGELNDATVKHNVAMNLTGADGAKTAASINLAERSFAVNLWLKYSQAGHIFTHGASDENIDLSVNAQGKLVVTVGGQSYTSTAALPQDKWSFLSFAYDADAESIYADYAEGTTSQNLFMNKTVGKYNGNGSITLGQGLTGQMHEVTLWDNARTFFEAQSEMYTRKTRYSDGLIGYWRMDEGHGSLATDNSRSRDLTLPGENAWYLAGDNYAMKLDGAHAAAVNTGNVVTDNEQSYTMELWFQADKQQAGAANIVGFNNANQLDIYLDANGKMKMDALGTTYDVSTTDYRDGQWHHLALNALKSSNGNATVYVDGTAMKSISAATVPAIATSKLLFGCHRTESDYDMPLKGAVDEIRIWGGRRTADVIKNTMYTRVDEKAEGLMAYYPFEKVQLDEADIAETVQTLTDQTLVTSQPITYILGGDAVVTSKENTPALKTAPALQNVAFNFVASERKILITLDENPERLENCIVHLTAKSIRDVHNNESERISWDVLVRQNQLLWASKEIDVRKVGTETATFTMGIENNGATSQNWTISGMPSWLTANTESGSLSGASDRKVTFTVDPSLAIGKYETTVYLTGDLGIAEPLVVNVTSAGEAPNWVATPGESTMVVLGQLKVDGKLSTDTEDMIAAFRGQECVGVAHPKYFQARDAYYTLMSIYGGSDDTSDLTYKVYDASTGQIYPSVEASNSGVLTFEADNSVGTFTNPVIFTTKNEIEQDLAMQAKGWKWMSFYVNPANKGIAEVYSHAGDAINAIGSRNASALYSENGWLGNLTSFDTKQMYKVNANAAFSESIVGAPAATASTTITLNNGWTWIGYPATASNSLNAAFAGADPQDGDIVKSQNLFAVYNGAAWEGSLEAMEPGVGYMYQSKAAASKTFQFAVPTAADRKNIRRRNVPVLELDYRDNMTMVAQVMNGDELIEDAEVTVYTADQLSGYSAAAISDKHYLTIGGNEDGATVFFVVRVGEFDYILRQGLRFEADAQFGSAAAPYILQINDATSVDGIGADEPGTLYDLAGRKLKQKFNTHGIYIQDGVKVAK